MFMRINPPNQFAHVEKNPIPIVFLSYAGRIGVAPPNISLSVLEKAHLLTLEDYKVVTPTLLIKGNNPI